MTNETQSKKYDSVNYKLTESEHAWMLKHSKTLKTSMSGVLRPLIDQWDGELINEYEIRIYEYKIRKVRKIKNTSFRPTEPQYDKLKSSGLNVSEVVRNLFVLYYIQTNPLTKLETILFTVPYFFYGVSKSVIHLYSSIKHKIRHLIRMIGNVLSKV